MSEPIMLNIGCGDKLLSGYVNIDLANNWSNKQPDVISDIRAIDLPDEYAHEAMAIHVIEHLYRWDVPAALIEWRRLLKPGAELILECPSLDKVMKLFWMYMRSGAKFDPDDTIYALYGDPVHKSVEMLHKWCYTSTELIAAMRDAGFKDVREEQPKFHKPHRDMRIVGVKA